MLICAQIDVSTRSEYLHALFCKTYSLVAPYALTNAIPAYAGCFAHAHTHTHTDQFRPDFGSYGHCGSIFSHPVVLSDHPPFHPLFAHMQLRYHVCVVLAVRAIVTSLLYKHSALQVDKIFPSIQDNSGGATSRSAMSMHTWAQGLADLQLAIFISNRSEIAGTWDCDGVVNVAGWSWFILIDPSVDI